MKRLRLLILLLTACAHPRAAEQQPVPQGPVEQPQGPVEQTLRAVAGGAEIPSDFAVVYTDEHGMWGGTRISISATGAYEWRYSNRERDESQRIEGSITEAQLRDLIGFMVELRAWRQETPTRPPVPDESAATLIIQAGGSEARMWEWYNEMRSSPGSRLSRIAARMGELRAGLPAGAGPNP